MSAAAAIRCAARIQRALAKHQQEYTGYPLKVRIGATAGEPVEREHDLFGATVQLAARLYSHAQPEQILVSNVVMPWKGPALQGPLSALTCSAESPARPFTAARSSRNFLAALALSLCSTCSGIFIKNPRWQIRVFLNARGAAQTLIQSIEHG